MPENSPEDDKPETEKERRLNVYLILVAAGFMLFSLLWNVLPVLFRR